MGKKNHQAIVFDRHGKCPICRKPFKSEQCPHTHGYVEDVVKRANSNFDRDVARLRRLRGVGGKVGGV